MQGQLGMGQLATAPYFLLTLTENRYQEIGAVPISILCRVEKETRSSQIIQLPYLPEISILTTDIASCLASNPVTSPLTSPSAFSLFSNVSN